MIGMQTKQGGSMGAMRGKRFVIVLSVFTLLSAASGFALAQDATAPAAPAADAPAAAAAPADATAPAAPAADAPAAAAPADTAAPAVEMPAPAAPATGGYGK